MELRRKVLDVLDRTRSRQAAARAIYKDRPLALYAIEIGLMRIASDRRKIQHRNIKRAILEPEEARSDGFIPRVLSRKTIERMTKRHLNQVLAWRIGSLDIFHATKADMLSEAAKERVGAKGKILNALIYEALAKPMNDTQTGGQYYRSFAAVAAVKSQVERDLAVAA